MREGTAKEVDGEIKLAARAKDSSLDRNLGFRFGFCEIVSGISGQRESWMVNEGLEVEESGGRRRPIKLMFRRVRYPLQTRRLRIYIPLKTMSFYNIGSWNAIRGIASKKITKL